MAVRLTDYGCQHAKQGITWDKLTIGLGLRVTKSGTRTWIMQLVWPGQRSQSRRALGRYPGLSLDTARTKAREWYDMAREGIDPFEIERSKRAKVEAERDNTFEQVALAYVAARKGVKKRAPLDEREIRRNLISAWGNKPIASITPRDVRQLIEAKLKRGVPYEAKNAWTHLDQIFKRAVHDELIPVSPAASLNRRLLFANAVMKPRERVLNDDEICALWHSTFQVLWPYSHAYRWLLLSGCRHEEALGCQWEELHPELRKVLRDRSTGRGGINWSKVPADHKLWTVPEERFKSGSQHVVPLTDTMCEQLASLPHMSGAHVFSFNGGKLWSNSLVKKQLDSLMLGHLRCKARERGDNANTVTLAPWVVHDLRRVVRSNMAALGVPDNVAELVLGHGRKGLQRVYDRHRYLPEIRSALTKWNSRLVELAGDA